MDTMVGTMGNSWNKDSPKDVTSFKKLYFNNLEFDFGDCFIEGFPLNTSNLQLERAGLTRTHWAGECSGTPG